MTTWIQDRANELLRGQQRDVKRVPFAAALEGRDAHAKTTSSRPTSSDLRNVIDMDAIRAAGLKLGVDPLGGAAVHYWEPITEIYGLDITVVNPKVDPTFSFMTVDHDGKIRMDCSSPYAMARLVGLKDHFHVAFANDPDADRHGIVTPSAGLMNPNHYPGRRHPLPARRTARSGPRSAAVGKTLVSSSLIDRVVDRLGRRLCEVPVGFKWFAPGLFDGSCCFGGEESAGRELPAPRRHRLDDRQGRPDPGPAGRRDHRPHGQGPRRALPRADAPSSARRTTRASTPRRHRSRRRS